MKKNIFKSMKDKVKVPDIKGAVSGVVNDAKIYWWLFS